MPHTAVQKRLHARESKRREEAALRRRYTDHVERNKVRNILDFGRRFFKTPYIERFDAPMYIADLLSVVTYAPPELRGVFLRKSAQVGATTALQLLLAYTPRLKRHSVTVQPTEQAATMYRRDFISPLFRNIEELQLLDDTVTRDLSTQMQKVFDDCSIKIIAGTSPQQWRSFSCHLLMIDELDSWKGSVGKKDDGEGYVVSLAERAVMNRQGRIFACSTPTAAHGRSRIIMETETCKLNMVWVFPCPSCGEYHDLQWELLKWPKGRPQYAKHICPHCAAELKYADYLKATDGGVWSEAKRGPSDKFPVAIPDGRYINAARVRKPVLTNDNGSLLKWPKKMGFNIWAGYSPWVSWGETVSFFLENQGTPDRVQVAVEQRLAREWDRESERVDEHKLKGLSIPCGTPRDCKEAQTCIVSVDVQKDHLVLMASLWWVPHNALIVDTRELLGGHDELGKGSWQAFADYMANSKWLKHDLPIHCLVDIGFRQDTIFKQFDFMRREAMLRPIKQYLPVKGFGNWNVQPMQPGRTQDGRAFGKVNIYNVKRSQIAHLESGVIRCADHIDPAAYRELASEEVRIGNNKGRRTPSIVQVEATNDLADCLTYAYAMFMHSTASM